MGFFFAATGFFPKNVRELGSQVPDFVHAFGSVGWLGG